MPTEKPDFSIIGLYLSDESDPVINHRFPGIEVFHIIRQVNEFKPLFMTPDMWLMEQ